MASAITTSASSLEGQAYEIALELLARENALPEDSRPDNAQVEFDTEASTVTITITLNTTLNLNGAEAQITVNPYLA